MDTAPRAYCVKKRTRGGSAAFAYNGSLVLNCSESQSVIERLYERKKNKYAALLSLVAAAGDRTYVEVIGGGIRESMRSRL